MSAAPDSIDRLLGIMARLRDPADGCPWDKAQDFSSIAPYTIEEAYEVADAIAETDWDALADELGDLLFQVVFHARMAEERAYFAFSDVVLRICEKMERRHPHVFADTPYGAEGGWEALKADERAAKTASGNAPASLLDGVGLALPALVRAEKLQKRAARGGFDWPDPAPVFAKVEEELAELKREMAVDGAPDPSRVAEEIGDLLFACVNLARHLKVDAETALRDGTRKFDRRFRRIEAELRKRGRGPAESDLAEMDALWTRVKLDEK
ncbi:MAG: nucleoside triphosphate pyrophosphohydrolase [Alphaproteobacteria bacterium]|nr:nucleoside triphosphate pyrophosphohydrolase [Alphaproteobacteria bacterium]